ncbi:probable tetraacyldisaccharide 4'-kinase, mitochondrial [Mangifera indica]|uniref:probable tetraacyldisaccharide 4'-kinase, mitochondrial n=1 Tax=Mangifera indica TaxID=29780 RepID=UPI001CFAFFD7|nr:probable tetraacyldisaccharide 4'-kinase, mitochondrial [Mangifera indica]XP_044480915.1 probable tetraacyldisaccharide 4'-kinase, mitochondrial [Mangifera indica]XP_044490602.1 probable tetraacyldisaccharide 4'-kinase, mitochondrial [Mangifera indica]XP_044490611.1 probable tetraacyldisaccharide 4'-kinase, mitochondrial [Mangifera indica]
MERLRALVNEIAYAQDHAKLSPLQSSIVPLLSFASSLYSVTLSLRRSLYHFGFFSKHRLAVPVISVGNLTWGGNGKTPMVEFIAHSLADSGISPLILTRGYAGGDEARMLQRHLLGRPVKIGVGANRAATAASFFEKYGYVDPRGCRFSQRINIEEKVGDHLKSEQIAVVILDDGMQHWSLSRDLEIVMVNGLMRWGNHQLLPLGPLREPLMALKRADVAVVHHADLISEQNLKDIESEIREIRNSLPIYFTRMAPSCFFEVENVNSEIPLTTVCNSVLLCVSAIGSADAFAQDLRKLGAHYVDRVDFSDHHLFQAKDIEMIRKKLGELEVRFNSKPIVVVTEKDYDRDSEVLKHLQPFKVLVLCSKLQIMPHRGCSEDSFKKLLKEYLE